MNYTTTLTIGRSRTAANRHPDRASARAECATPSGRAATGAGTPQSDRAAIDSTARPANETAITAEGDR